MAAAKSKKILITGVTRGLGRALAEKFLSQGHAVLGCGRTAEAIQHLREQENPSDFAVVDVTDRQQVSSWARRLLKSHGAPDLLINNAALINRNALLWEVPAEEFDQVIDVNIKGVANVIRAFVPAMVARQSGVIVNLSSGWGRSTAPEVAPYCASKYAIEGLTLALAQDLPNGMAAVPLNPGIIDTDMLRQAWSDGASAYPKADQWAKRAAPFLLGLSVKDNGRSLSVD